MTTAKDNTNKKYKVLRATETWQQAGAYYVRIQAMARQYDISLREEFDEHDTPKTKYIVILDGDFPVATCRLFERSVENNGCNANSKSPDVMILGRVVVLEEYREQGLGRLVIEEAEKWAGELGAKKVVLESRDVAVGFYEKMGYVADCNKPVHEAPFRCVYMEKTL